MNRKLCLVVTLVALSCGGGCQMTAPIHIWSPPLAAEVPEGTIAMAPLDGDAQMARAVEAAMLEAVPQEAGRLIKPNELRHPLGIQLASAETGTSDIASLSAARHSGAKALLYGEVLTKSPGMKIGATAIDHTPKKISVAWRLLDVEDGQNLGGAAFTLDLASALRNNEDLSVLGMAEQDLLTTAAARESWHVIAPFVQKQQANLILPWISLGAERIRRGNALARVGRWPEAEAEWTAVAEKYPRNHRAWHNLAIGAVARQDFDTARERIRQAMSFSSSKAYVNTFGWIESQRREYHQAFHLPEPKDGWPLSLPLQAPQ